MDSVLKDKNENSTGSPALNLSLLKADGIENSYEYTKENHNPKSLLEIAAVDCTESMNVEIILTPSKREVLSEPENHENAENQNDSFKENNDTETGINPKSLLDIAADINSKWNLESTSTPLNHKTLSRIVPQDNLSDSYSAPIDLGSTDHQAHSISFLIDGLNDMKLNNLNPTVSDDEDEFLSFNNNPVVSQQSSFVVSKEESKCSNMDRTFEVQEQQQHEEGPITSLNNHPSEQLNEHRTEGDSMQTVETESDQTPTNEHNVSQTQEAVLDKTEIVESAHSVSSEEKDINNVTEVLETIRGQMHENHLMETEVPEEDQEQENQNDTVAIDNCHDEQEPPPYFNNTEVIATNQVSALESSEYMENDDALQDVTMKSINKTFEEVADVTPSQPQEVQLAVEDRVPQDSLQAKSDDFKFAEPAQIALLSTDAVAPDEVFTSAASYDFGDSDFDFLQKFGKGSVDDVGRDSVLLKFDPLFEKPVLQKHLTLGRLPETKEEDSFSDLVLKDFEIEQHSIGSAGGSYSNIDEFPSPRLFSPSKNAKNMSVDIMKDISSQNDKIDSNLECEDIKQLSSINNEEQSIKLMELENKLKMEAEQREEALLKRISEKDKQISKMNNVVEAYEKAIAELIAEKEQLIQSYEKKCNDLKGDSEMNAQHLASLESTFSDLHAKYERTKQIASELKDREESILQDRKTLQDNLKMQEARYEKMKTHAMSQLEIANNKLAEMLRNHQAEVTKLKAQLKKEEISRASVHEQLIQKSKENAELVKICDELIGNHGNSQTA